MVHLQGCADCSVGIVLVRDRSTEHRQDAIAENLVDAATERVDVSLQRLERTVDHAFDLLGIEPLGESGVADKVGEKHRHHPPLFR